MRISSRTTIKTTENPERIHAFKRAERLKSRQSIGVLFERGQRRDAFPLRFIFLENQQQPVHARMMVSVPKRLMKRAVDRNLLKRRIREAYRHQKAGFYDKLQERRISLVIQYRTDKVVKYRVIEEAMEKGLDKLLLQLHRPNG